MIEAALGTLRDTEGVNALLLLEKDGFVVFQHGEIDANMQRTEALRWLALSGMVEDGAMTTVVMERGYVLLKPTGERLLIVVCQRTVNLGAVRKRLKEFQWSKQDGAT
tara:strand:+ start:234 stop:557 length:324 start_codon:yes stop_codon:yes gene_type:complete